MIDSTRRASTSNLGNDMVEAAKVDRGMAYLKREFPTPAKPGTAANQGAKPPAAVPGFTR
jgi:hypothetical protein